MTTPKLTGRPSSVDGVSEDWLDAEMEATEADEAMTVGTALVTTPANAGSGKLTDHLSILGSLCDICLFDNGHAGLRARHGGDLSRGNDAALSLSLFSIYGRLHCIFFDRAVRVATRAFRRRS